MFANPEQAFGGSARMLETIESIYAAAQDSSLWPGVIAGISELVRGESVALYAAFPNARTPNLFALANTSPEVWQAFADYYASVNPLLVRGEATLNPDVPWSSDMVIQDSELEQTEFYNDFYLPNDMHYSGGVPLKFPDSPSAYLSVQRAKQIGPFGEREFLIFSTLMPHLRRSLMLHSRMSLLQAEVWGFDMALEAYECAVLGLDVSGKVMLCNRRAQEIVTSGQGLRILQGRLRSSSQIYDARLQRIITSALNSCLLEPAAGAIAIPSTNSDDELLVTIFPVSKSVSGRSLPLAALAFVSDAGGKSSRAFALKQLYGLTPAEIRVTDLLMQGMDAREIAEQLRITLETSRFRIKKILAKTGTRKQSELLKLSLSLPSTPKP